MLQNKPNPNKSKSGTTSFRKLKLFDLSLKRSNFLLQNPLATIEEERREHQAKMTKMEKEMEEVFERKVREKKNKLNDSEIDLDKRHRESKEKLDSQKRELEAQRAAFLVTIYLKNYFLVTF